MRKENGMFTKPQMLTFTGELRSLLAGSKKTVWDYFRDGKKKVSAKSPTELVGELDLLLERWLMMFLPEFANVPVIGEESFHLMTGGVWPPQEKSFWLVDPVDGTHNFLMQNPNFGSIVALIEEGRVVFGAVYIHAEGSLKIPGQIYFAGKGLGAWKRVSGKVYVPLRVSETESLERATLLVEGPSRTVVRSELAQKARENTLRYYKGLSSSFALTRIANANHSSLPADILIMCGNKPWDSLAGALITEEAGGIVTGFDGGPYSLTNCTDLIYSNKILNKKILALR